MYDIFINYRTTHSSWVETLAHNLKAQGYRVFMDQVFDRLTTHLTLMILAQAYTNTRVYARALRRQAETLYGADNVLHIFPLVNTRADSRTHFGRLASQHHFQEVKYQPALCALLARKQLGKYDPWPTDKLLRQLYWSNLVVRRGRDFCRRCDFIRQAGREMLACV